MKQTISEHDFIQAFTDCGRGDQFSYKALGLIYDNLCQFEDDCGTEIELDPIAVCCEYVEQEWDHVAGDYSIDLSDTETDDEGKEMVIDYLQENTHYVGETPNGLVYQSF